MCMRYSVHEQRNGASASPLVKGENIMTLNGCERENYIKNKAEEYRKVLTGEAALPQCGHRFPRCAEDSTHVSKRVTPAGYHLWRCEEHAIDETGPLWGSDPGWLTEFVPIYDKMTE